MVNSLVRIFCIGLLGVGCTPSPSHKPMVVNRSFYYWKSVFDLSDYERMVLAKQNIKTIYLRYFDVGWDAALHRALPMGTLREKETGTLSDFSLEIIPTVFITNETMLNVKESEVEKLADDILKLINEINRVNGMQEVHQIQIDCDWNASSRDKYFRLLEAMQQIDTTRLFSATLRLHQMKYARSTGVPPVQRCLLMCYNMGDLKKLNTQNSILDPTTVEAYLKGFSGYPLPLDVAFPIFGWTVLFRNGQYTGLLPQMNPDDLKGISTWNETNRYRILRDTLFMGYALQQDDELRVERSVLPDILKASSLLKGKTGTDSFSMALYQLDSILLYQFTQDELETIFNSMH